MTEPGRSPEQTGPRRPSDSDDVLIRARILRAADDLIRRLGVAATTLADVEEASETNAAGLRRHFPDEQSLVLAVISSRAATLLFEQRERFEHLDSIHALEEWRDVMVERNAVNDGLYGCELGSLAHQLGGRDPETREVMAGHFDTWQQLIADGFERLRDRGVLRPDADAPVLAALLLSSLQGGYLLAQVAGTVVPMRSALDSAISYVRTFADGPSLTPPIRD